MTSFRKMRLVNDNVFDPTRVMKHETAPSVSRMSDLDLNIESILNQNVDADSKAKLYSQTLRRFLTYKKQHQEEDVKKSNEQFEKLKKLLTKKKTTRKSKSKTKANAQTNKTPKSPDKSKLMKFMLMKKIVRGPKKSKKRARIIKSDDDYDDAHDLFDIQGINWDEYDGDDE